MIRLLSILTASLFLVACAALKQTTTNASDGEAKPALHTGTVKVRVEFGNDGRVVNATVIEKTGVMKKIKPEDDELILGKIRKWKVPGKTGVVIIPIRFTFQ